MKNVQIRQLKNEFLRAIRIIGFVKLLTYHPESKAEKIKIWTALTAALVSLLLFVPAFFADSGILTNGYGYLLGCTAIVACLGVLGLLVWLDEYQSQGGVFYLFMGFDKSLPPSISSICVAILLGPAVALHSLVAIIPALFAILLILINTISCQLEMRRERREIAKTV